MFNVDRETLRVGSEITNNFTGSGLAVLQGAATVYTLKISKENLKVEQNKAVNIIATLGTEAKRNTAQALYYTKGADILADIHLSNASLITVRSQLILKLATCVDQTERANILSTINVINESLGANNCVVGATLNNGAAAQQIIQ